jgi:class 3 adenylate cyclase
MAGSRLLLIFRAWLLSIVLCVPRSASAGPIEGDALRSVVSLAGTWSITTSDLTPAEAAASDLRGWGSVAVPGTWSGTPYEGSPLAWYGIDFRTEARDGSFSGAAIALPPFLYAYEVFAGGLSLGASGQAGPTLEWGPFRHTAFPVPETAWGVDGVLRVRVRVTTWSGAVRGGTNDVADAQAIAIGPASEIARLVDLGHLRARMRRPLGGGTHFLMLGIAIVFLALFALTPTHREYAYFSAYLVLSTAAALRSEAATLGDLARPLPPILESAVLASLSGVAALLMLGRLFGLESWYFRATVGLQLVFLAGMGVVWIHPDVMHHGHWFSAYLSSQTVMTLAYMLGALARSARQNLPDARLMIAGFGIGVVIVLTNNAYGLAYPHEARSATAVPTGWLGLIAGLVWALTMTLVLARRYRRSIDDLQQAFAASTRFVPSAFLHLLGRENVTDVKRGDRTHRDMTVLFCDIRGFTPLAERLGPEETIVFLNRYLLAIEPAIVERRGFINQYYGDGIMALFERADDAVEASLAMVQAVDAFNLAEAARSGERVRIGVGLNAGLLAMGTIGGETRLDSGVVGDAVNTAARVEGMTKVYKARVLLTDAVRDRMSHPRGADLREVDRVLAVGKSVALTLFELVLADPPDLLEGKRATRPEFVLGLERLRASDLEAAAECFAACLARVADDGSAALWGQRCDEWRRQGIPNDWDGVTVLSSK